MTSPRRSEDGATLLEILMAVMVVGVAFVALLGGLGTSVISSDLHRKQAVAETTIRRYAEAVKQVQCSPTCPSSASSAYTASALGVSLPDGFTADDPKCRDNTDVYVDACPTTGYQVVKIGIKDDKVDASLEVVKRPG